MRRAAWICLAVLVVFAMGLPLTIWANSPPDSPPDNPPDNPLSLPALPERAPLLEPREALPYLPGQAEEQAPQADPALQQTRREDFFRLVYQIFDNNDWEIQCGSGLLTGDGTQITNNRSMDIQPRYNRGAARIAFVSDRTGNYEIWTMNPDGADARQLTFDPASDLNPDWSPDGSRIAFNSDRAGQAEIYVINSDGSGLTRLTENPAYDGYPVWSPDGTKIAFVSDRGSPGNVHVWVMAADGSSPVQLNTQFFSENPAWSPDGRQIAYDADGDGNGWQELWVMNADGSNPRRLYNPPAGQDAWARSWTPDGLYVAYTRIQFVNYQGAWYWTWASTNAIQLDGFDEQVSSGITNWYPDWDSIDPWPPNTYLEQLPAESPATFTVRWSAADVGPAGVFVYDLQVQDSDGPWTSLLEWVGGVDHYEYTGKGGHTYRFRCRAYDFARNTVAWEAAPQVSTTVESQPPVSAMSPLPPLSQGRIILRWSGSDPGGSGIERYDLQARDGADGEWVNCPMNINMTVIEILGKPGHTYYFRCRAIDRAGNVESWPADNDGETFTTLYAWEMRGAVRDVRGRPIPGAALQIAPAPVLAAAQTGTNGNYRSYFAMEGDYALRVPLNGYGAAPTMTLTLNQDLTINHILPPLDDVVVNGGLETGALADGWQTAGAIPPALTDTIRHTGDWAALLGQPPQPVPPTNVSRSGGDTHWGHGMALGQDGSVHVVWSQRTPDKPFTAIYYAARTPDGQWSWPVLLSVDLPGSERPGVLVAPDGGVHVFWSRWDGLRYNYQAPGRGWSGPQRVPASLQYPSPESYTVACDKWGNLHLLLVQEDRTNYYKYLLYTVRDPSGAWSPTSSLDLTDDKEGARFSPYGIVAGPDGTLHTLWERSKYDETIGAHVTVLLYATKPPNGPWTPPAAMPDWAYNQYRLATDSQGTLSFICRDDTIGQEGLVLVTKAPNGAWSSPQRVLSGPGEAPCIAYGPDDALFMVWQTDRYAKASQIMLASRSPGGQWSEPRLYAAGLRAALPLIGVDSRGAPHVVWLDTLFEGVEYELASEIFYRTPMPSVATVTGDSTLRQTLDIPADLHAPTLSFLYWLEGASAGSGSWFDVSLTDGAETSTLLHRATATQGWAHGWLDVSAWAGRTVTLSFTVRQAAGQPNTWAYLDEVTLGSWLTPAPQTLTPARVSPGMPVQCTITGDNLDCPAWDGGDCALSLFLNDIPLVDVIRLDAHTLTASIPGPPLGRGLPYGRYDLVITDAAGRSGALPGALLVGDEARIPLIYK